MTENKVPNAGEVDDLLYCAIVELRHGGGDSVSLTPEMSAALLRHLEISSVLSGPDYVNVLRNDVKYAMGFIYSHERTGEPLNVWARFANALRDQPDPNAAQQAADIAASAQPRIPRTAHG